LRAEVARLRRIEAVAVDFCARCERGEIRSTNTYVRFLTALRPSERSLPEAPRPSGGASRGEDDDTHMTVVTGF
jgi:hypothetical protein